MLCTQVESSNWPSIVRRSTMKLSIVGLLIGLTILLLSPLSWAITYSYDGLNRLTAVDYGNGTSQTYSYDAAGNLLAMISSSSSRRRLCHGWHEQQ